MNVSTLPSKSKHVGRDHAKDIIEDGWKSLKSDSIFNSIFDSLQTRTENAADTDLWNVREQIFLAALDTHELDVCESMLSELNTQFPESERVLMLHGLLFEAQGKTKKASEVYDKFNKLNEVSMVVIKRRVSLLMSSGKLNDAIKMLVNYLGDFGADTEAWKQLGLLYIEVGNMRNAVFCLEEVLIGNPHSYLCHIILAEALYTLGGEVENVVLARKYFSQSLLSNSHSARALFGLAVTTLALKEHSKKSKNKATQSLIEYEKNENLNSKALAELANLPMVSGMDELIQAAIRRLALS